MTSWSTATSSTPGSDPTASAHPADQLVDLGVVGHREGELDGHPLALDLHRPDHAQLPQRTPQFGVDDAGNEPL